MGAGAGSSIERSWYSTCRAFSSSLSPPPTAPSSSFSPPPTASFSPPPTAFFFSWDGYLVELLSSGAVEKPPRGDPVVAVGSCSEPINSSISAGDGKYRR